MILKAVRFERSIRGGCGRERRADAGEQHVTDGHDRLRRPHRPGREAVPLLSGGGAPQAR